MTNWITLRWPWALLALALAALVIFLAWKAFDRHARNPQTVARRLKDTDAAVVWNLEQDMATEHADALWKRWKTMNRLAACLIALCLVLGFVLLARPSRIDSESSTTSTRDIVLCLDVSGSTLPYDREVIATYRELVKHFQGERIGLSIFNSTSRTVFPLTDDYDLVERQLAYADGILKGVIDQDSIDKMSDKQYQQVSDWLEGTQNRTDVTSLIGDGLVSCAAMLPEFSVNGTDGTDGKDSASGSDRNADRNGSIVLATDNVLSGTPMYRLDQALDLTRGSSITVDGLYSGAKETNNEATAQQMKDQIESHGGIFLTQSSNSTVGQLVRQIDSQRTRTDESDQRSNLVDTPEYWVPALVVLFAGFMIMAWRLRR
ncbi:VWA domain-containing protein [Bifidobacterium margollesii]|uniref:VWA domain-containing protein n=1 Tax=Bifidobacterium margollesii TaxID=2020964 RepID=A0A2N5J7E2_9BIFI|nr:VWA domain-containing protein [Bifidobacterium margollesii]PLS30138.1 VWA domain-containing protein [Bifidobacterium margollesii]